MGTTSRNEHSIPCSLNNPVSFYARRPLELAQNVVIKIVLLTVNRVDILLKPLFQKAPYDLSVSGTEYIPNRTSLSIRCMHENVHGISGIGMQPGRAKATIGRSIFR